MIVLEKDIGLVKIALSIMKLVYPKLKNVSDFGTALKLIEENQKLITVT